MQPLHSYLSIGISDLRSAPALAFEQASEHAVVVLNHNKPAGYIVSPEWMQRMMDQLADQVIVSKARSRVSDVQAKSTKVRRIQLDDL
jgi:antitoxin StbD